MKTLLKSRVWWPTINEDIEKYVEVCQHCQLNGEFEKPVPMKMSKPPEEPWTILAIDYNGPYNRFGGISICVLFDSFSRFIVVKEMQNGHTTLLVDFLEEQFRFYGKPTAIKSDNGPQFTSKEYQAFLDKWGVQKFHSVPLHPQQNGAAERYMKLINDAMTAETLKEAMENLKERIDQHNRTINRMTKQVPRDVMFGRKFRDNLPLLGQTVVDQNLKATL